MHIYIHTYEYVAFVCDMLNSITTTRLDKTGAPCASASSPPHHAGKHPEDDLCEHQEDAFSEYQNIDKQT